MTKISVSLTQESYSANISNYLVNRPAFKIVAGILLMLIIFAGVMKLITPDSVPALALIIWSVLWCVYIFLIPHFIKTQANTIYNNTRFLHDEMTFEFTDEAITWTTSVGTRTFPLAQIYKIATTSTALVVSFTRYQVLPIPYSAIDSNDWEQLQIYLKKLNSKPYQKYSQQDK